NPRCRFRCDAIEDQHRIFVDCSHYAPWHDKAAEEIVSRTNNKLAKKGIEEADRVDLLTIAKSLFQDDDVIWPLQYCTFYLGHILKFNHFLPKIPNSDKLAHMQLAHHFASDWHTASIRLAGRIWGDVQRRMA
ncbi:hypothetical protein C8R44DRAFT_544901, partial [Mycena epipterygia]